MRILFRAVAVLLGLLGVVVSLAGVAAAVLVGSDDTVPVIDQAQQVEGVAVATATGFFTHYGPVLHLTVTSRRTGQAPLFIGVAPSFQVTDYLKGQQRSEMTGYTWPDGLSMHVIAGNTDVAAPGELDFWSLKTKATGRAALAWPVANGPNTVVVMRSDGSAVGEVDLEAGLELKGLFATGCTLAAAGLGTIGLAVLIVVLTRRRPIPYASEATP